MRLSSVISAVAAAASLCWGPAMGSPLATNGNGNGRVEFETRQSYNSSRLAFYPAPKNNCRGIGVLVLPGGGYGHVSLDKEGRNSTTYLNDRGYDAWVLNYSTSADTPTPLYPIPQDEAVAAVRYIRGLSRVKRLGIWGYSAGGHLAAVTVTNPDIKLDFGILAYPVITMKENITHAGSRTNLLGDDPSPELVEKMSAENSVSDSTPPIFLFHTANDPTVSVANSLLFINAMTTHQRPYSALILPKGNHGVGLAFDDPVLNWTAELDRWMKYSI